MTVETSAVLVDQPVNKTTLAPQRLHPISLAFEIVSGIRQQLLPAIFAAFSAVRGGVVGLIFGVCFLVFSITTSILRYLAFRYQIREGELIVDEGILFKVHRTVPLKRIQNIDLLQNPLHRLFRVAEVRIETASGTEPEAILRVISLSDVELLRSLVFANSNEREVQLPSSSMDQSELTHRDSSGERIESTAERGTGSVQDAQRLLSLSVSMLIKAGLASNRGMLMVAVLFGALFQFSPWEWNRRFHFEFDFEALMKSRPIGYSPLGWVAVGIAILLGTLVLLRLLSALWYVFRFYGYELRRNGEDLRIRCGLLTKVSATVPRNRIQFISIHRTWLGKRLGVASIRIETAGGGAESNEDAAATISRQWFVPAIGEEEIATLLEEVRPGLNWNEGMMDWQPISKLALKRMRRVGYFATGIGLAPAIYFQSGIAIGLVLALGTLIWWLAGKKASSTRYARGPFGIAYRSGMLLKKCSVTFPESIQSVRIDSSLFDRRWGMATLSIDTPAAGPAQHTIEVAMLDERFARQERDAIALSASRSTITKQRPSLEFGPSHVSGFTA